MATTTRARKQARPPAEAPATAGERPLDQAFARAICALAVAMPGGPATTRQILIHQFTLSAAHADAIIAAAEHPA